VVAVVTPMGKLVYISPSIERMGFEVDAFMQQVGLAQ